MPPARRRRGDARASRSSSSARPRARRSGRCSCRARSIRPRWPSRSSSSSPAPRPPRPSSGAVSAPELPGSMERRSGPSDPARARKAAAEALLARARELRGRTAGAGQRPAGAEPATAPAPAEAAAGLDALFELEPPGRRGRAPAAASPSTRLRPARRSHRSRPTSGTVVPRPRPRRRRSRSSCAQPGRGRATAEPLAAPPAPSSRPAGRPSCAGARTGSASTPRRRLARRQRSRRSCARLREQLEADRRRHDEELHTVIERATAHEQAALEQQAGAAEAGRPAGPPPRPRPASARRWSSSATAPRRGRAARRAAAEATLARAAGRAGPAWRSRTARRGPPRPSSPTSRRSTRPRRRPAGAPSPAAPRPTPPPSREPAADAAWARPALEAPPAELRGGNLDDLPMARLLAVAWRARAAGRLDVAGDATRALWFEDGARGRRRQQRRRRAASTRWRCRLGLLTRDQHRQVAGAVAGLASRRAAVLLVDRGLPEARRADRPGAGPDRGGGLRHLRRGQRPLPLGRRSGPGRRADRAGSPAAGAGGRGGPPPLAGAAHRGHPRRPGHAGDAGPRRPHRRGAGARCRRSGAPWPAPTACARSTRCWPPARSTPSRPASCSRRWCWSAPSPSRWCRPAARRRRSRPASTWPASRRSWSRSGAPTTSPSSASAGWPRRTRCRAAAERLTAEFQPERFRRPPGGGAAGAAGGDPAGGGRRPRGAGRPVPARGVPARPVGLTAAGGPRARISCAGGGPG